MTDEITHHLTDALLMAYSAGTLPEAFNLAVATHVSMCDACRAAADRGAVPRRDPPPRAMTQWAARFWPRPRAKRWPPMPFHRRWR